MPYRKHHSKRLRGNPASYYIRVKLRNAKTIQERHAIRMQLERYRRAFYKRETLRVLKTTDWPLSKINEWLNTERQELDGLSPKQALKVTIRFYGLPKRAFYVLLRDLGLIITDIKVKPTPVTFDDNIE